MTSAKFFFFSGLVFSFRVFADTEKVPRPVLVVTGLAAEARIAAGPDVLVILGSGNSRKLEDQLKHFDSSRIRAVVSFGIAGALAPGLRAGDVVIANGLRGHQQQILLDIPWNEGLSARLGQRGLLPKSIPFTGIDDLTAFEPRGRAKLREETLADAVDQESHWAGEFAAREGLPFVILRSVSDTSTQILPAAARRPLREDGSIDPRALIGNLVRDPAQIGALIRLGVTTGKAFASLRKIREALGNGFGLTDKRTDPR